MTYDEAIDCDDLTQEEIKRELKKHHADFNEFINDVGIKDTYTGSEVLNWLGY